MALSWLEEVKPRLGRLPTTEKELVVVVEDDDAFMGDLVLYIGAVPAVSEYSCPPRTGGCYALRRSCSDLGVEQKKLT